MNPAFLDIGPRISKNLADRGDERFLTLYKPQASGEWQLSSRTYRQFVTWAGAIGADLRAKGARPGARVLLCMRHDWALHGAIAGCLLQGMVPVIFAQPSPKIRPDDYREMVLRLAAQLVPDAIVADPDLATLLRNHAPAVHSADALPPASAGDGVLPDFPPSSDPARTVLIQYSSGTTGLKKGVVLSARALLAQVDRYAEAIALGPADTVASWLPLYHDMGLMCCFLLPLLKGVPVASVSPFDWLGQPAVLLKMIERERSSLVWQPNFAFAYLASRFAGRRPGEFDLSSLRLVTNCSEPLTAEAVGAFKTVFAAHGLAETAVGGCYAMAETSFAVTATRPGDGVREAVATPAAKQGHGGQVLQVMSSGRPLADTEVRIGDGLLGEGTIGEIAVRSPSLMDGYLGVPASETFDGAGWYATGDLGFLEGGELFVVGRADDMIIVAGQNVHPHLVEEVVSRSGGIIPGRVAVFGVPSSRGLATADLVVMAETHAAGESDRRRISAGVSAAVGAAIALAPARVELVAPGSLRKSTSGKVSRGACRAAFLESRRTDAAAGNDGDFRTRVRAFVTDNLLGGLAVADDDPLITSAMIDSLGLAMLTAWLEAELGRPIPSPMSLGLERFDSIDALCRLSASRALSLNPLTRYLSDLIGFAERPHEPGRPRLLMFGDSVHERIQGAEAERRTVKQLVVERWQRDAALAISHSAYNSLVYREYLKAGVAVGRPADVVVLPINLRSFSPEWDSNPQYDLSTHVDALKSFADAPAGPLPAPVSGMARGQFDAAMAGFMARPIETPLSRIRTIGEFLAIRRSKPQGREEARRRLREVAIVQYALPIAPGHRQIAALLAAIDIAKHQDMGLVLYFTPIDVALARAVGGDDLAAAVARNLQTVAGPLERAAQGGRVVVRNWLSALPHEMFFAGEFSEHLLQAGRDWLAEQIVDAAREIAVRGG